VISETKNAEISETMKAKKFGLDMQILEVLRRRKFISAATPTINPVPVEEFLIYFKVQKTDLS